MSGPPWGVVPTGFQPKIFADIQADLEAAFQAQFGASIDLSPDGPYGQIIGILADRYADLWALSQAVYGAFDPDAAAGAALIALCGLTGTIPLPATPSSVVGVLGGTNGTVVNAGKIASVAGFPSSQFKTLADVTIATVPDWAISTNYATGALVKKGGNVYYATRGGLSAGSGGPTGTGGAITDNTVVWCFIAAGSAAVAATLDATVNGPTAALAQTLTVIATPVAGWTAVSNPIAASLGQNLETDAQLRIRREEELRAQGKGSGGAILAALEEVDAGTANPVTYANVIENPTDTVDGYGNLAHSILALVIGGVDADIAQAIFATKAAGINTNGTTSVTVTDSQGGTHVIKFLRPVQVPIYVVVDVTYLAGQYPTGAGGGTPGDTLVAEAIANFGASYLPGQSVVGSHLIAEIFKNVPGIFDVTSMHIGTAPSPGGGGPISISALSIADIPIGNITVVSTPGGP